MGHNIDGVDVVNLGLKTRVGVFGHCGNLVLAKVKSGLLIELSRVEKGLDSAVVAAARGKLSLNVGFEESLEFLKLI